MTPERVEFLKERLTTRIRSLEIHERNGSISSTQQETLDAFRIAIAGMKQEPVYLRPFGDDGEIFVACDSDDECAITLYAAPQLLQPAVVIDRQGIADRVHGKCSRIPGATFYNAAELAIDEVEACRASMLQGK